MDYVVLLSPEPFFSFSHCAASELLQKTGNISDWSFQYPTCVVEYSVAHLL